MASAIQLRPCTGSSCTCCGSMLPPSCDVATLMSGASPLTVTVSATPLGAIWRLMDQCLADQQLDVVALRGRETLQLRCDFVGADTSRNP
jgi:hypothetical protein